jgi:hypothetical protein
LTASSATPAGLFAWPLDLSLDILEQPRRIHFYRSENTFHPPNSLSVFSIALPSPCAQRRDPKIVRPLYAVELRAEFEVGCDLARRQRHCKVWVEAPPNEADDGEREFLKRIFTVFALSSAPTMRLVSSATKEPIPFGNVKPKIALRNLIWCSGNSLAACCS